MYLGQVKQDGTVGIVASFPDVDPGQQCPNLK
jgi:branched-chain amino acid transport system substrate-binding protein